ncbi:MAG: hypothetical protein PVH61_30055 [Candidatus Aminicenantes bacterium]|jgi:hypothetical protein
MMESLHLYPVLMALCLLISLNAAVLSERYETNRRIPADLEKVSGNTFLELIAIWAYILALRKLVYYIPIDGMIQTKTTVWWIEKKGSSYLYIFLFLALMMVLREMIRRLKQPRKSRKPIYPYEIIIIFVTIVLMFMGMMENVFGPGNFFLYIYYYITILLLSLKLVCSGTYFGFFTSFLLAYYITDARQIFNVSPGVDQKLKKEKTKSSALLIPFLLMIIGIYTYLRIPSGSTTWMNELLGQLRSARTHQQERAFDDLLDAANYMKDGVKKSRALGEIAVVMRQTGDIRRAKNILEQAANEIQQLQDRTLQFNAFRYLAMILKQSGDSISAGQMYKKTVESAQWIKESNERAKALSKVIWEIELLGDIEWAKDVFLAAIDAAEFIDSDSLKAKLFKKIVRVISGSTDKKWADPIYRKIALAFAKTGDIRQATAVAEKIADIETQDITLFEIRKRMEEK